MLNVIPGFHELQSASRILTSVMLYNPMKMGAPTTEI